MSERMEALFERDLTPQEFEKLVAEVEASPERAWSLSEAAARSYAGTGLPEPGHLQRPKLSWALGALALAGGLAWWSGQGGPRSLAVAHEDAALTEALEPAKPKRPPMDWARVTPQPELAPSMELALLPGAQGFPRLQILLRCRRQEVVSVDLEDRAGRVLRHLHSGPLPVGERRFFWDLQGPAGAQALPGVYFVRVSHAQGYELRAVELGLKR